MPEQKEPTEATGQTASPDPARLGEGAGEAAEIGYGEESGQMVADYENGGWKPGGQPEAQPTESEPKPGEAEPKSAPKSTPQSAPAPATSPAPTKAVPPKG